MGLGGPREADIVADYSGRSDWKRFWICDVELGELDLALPNFPQEILEHLNRELFSGATAIAETEWGGLLGELLADHGKCRPLAVIHAYQEMGDDDVLDIDRIELGKELLAEARDRRLYVRRSERSLGGLSARHRRNIERRRRRSRLPKMFCDPCSTPFLGVSRQRRPQRDNSGFNVPTV